MRGVTGGDGAVLTVEDGRQFYQRFQGLVFAHAIVVLHKFAVGQVDGHGFFPEFRARQHGFVVRGQREPVLLVARDAEIPVEHFGGLAHVQPASRIAQTEKDANARFEIAGTKRDQRLEAFAGSFRAPEQRIFFSSGGRIEQRDVRHALGTADDECVPLPGHHLLVRTRDGFEAAGAIAVNGVGRDFVRDTGGEGDDAGNVGGVGRLRDVSEDDVGQLGAVEAGPLQQLGHRKAAELLCRQRLQQRAGFAKWGSDSIDDRESFHGVLRAYRAGGAPRSLAIRRSVVWPTISRLRTLSLSSVSFSVCQ